MTALWWRRNFPRGRAPRTSRGRGVESKHVSDKSTPKDPGRKGRAPCGSAPGQSRGRSAHCGPGWREPACGGKLVPGNSGDRAWVAERGDKLRCRGTAALGPLREHQADPNRRRLLGNDCLGSDRRQAESDSGGNPKAEGKAAAQIHLPPRHGLEISRMMAKGPQK